MTDFFRERLAAALDPTYAIDDELTGGGMSRVFVATERALGRKVVVKVLPPDLAAGVNRERFQREIQLAAQLQHPHIVPLLSAGESGGLLYYTMPFIEGESLRHAIARRGRLPVRDVARILHDVVEALAYAHQRGVIHRDIKPGNILTIGSHALVTDFGVAKALSAAMPSSGMTSAGMAIGTPAYMAPEQLAADPSGDHRMDLYAVGLLAYELLTGESPFRGESPQATMAAQLTRVPDPIATVRDDVPASLEALVMKCLEKLPERRPSSADALLEALDGATTPTATAAPATVRLPAAPATADARTGVSPVVRFGLVGLGALALGGVVALGIWGGRRAEHARMMALANDSLAARRARTTVLDSTADNLARSPIQLTHAESLAIAEAVHKRMAPSDSVRAPRVAQTTRVIPDSAFIAQLERAIGDSVAKALEKLRPTAPSPAAAPDIPRPRAPGAVPVPTAPGPPGIGGSAAPMPDPAGTRRVAVFPLRAFGPGVVPGSDSLARAASDSVRQLLGRIPSLQVIDMPPDGRGSSTRMRVARAGAGAIVTTALVRRNDSLHVRIDVFDVARGVLIRQFESPAGPASDPLRNLPVTVTRVPHALDLVAWPGSKPPEDRYRRFQRPGDSAGRRRPPP